MEERNEEEENHVTSKPGATNEDEITYDEPDGDSDDGMEVDNFEDAKSSEKENGSELVDSDVNVEATELTSSDVDMSDELDSKNDLSSDADSNPYSPTEPNASPKKEFDQLNSDEEETFALEIKEGKEDSGDEEFAGVTNEECDDENEGNPKSTETIESCGDPVETTCKKEINVREENQINDQPTEKRSNELDQGDYSQSPKRVGVKDEKPDDNATASVEPQEVQENQSGEGQKEAVNEDVEKPLMENISPSRAIEGELKTNVHDAVCEAIKTAETTPVVSKEDVPTVESDIEQSLDNSELEPDFVGFDSTVINKTLQIFQILQENHEELIKSSFSTKIGSLDESTKSIDSPSGTEALPSTTSVISNQVSPNKLPNQTEEVSPENRNADDQIANSKRIKKKRKFFDEFEDSEGEPAKKPHLMKERENTSNLDNNLSENKENFMSSEKHSIKDDILCESSTTSSALASSTPNPPKMEGKGRFDITNPDFKEPFKYGWRREVVYRFISDDGRKRSADVSYFNPQGKKLRSIKQINDHLPSDGSLSVRNFTFSKELIFGNRESDLEVIRFTKKMEMELLTNESDLSENLVDGKLGVDAVSSIIDRKLGIEPIPGEDQPKTDSAKKVPSKKKETHSKFKTNIKNPPSQGFDSTTPTAKSKSSKKSKPFEADMEETFNATPKLAMPKIMLRGPSMNSNSAQKSVLTKPAGMKIKMAPSKSNNQKTAKKSSKSKSEKGSKSQKDKRDKNGTGDLEMSTLSAEWKASNLQNISPGDRSGLNNSVASNFSYGSLHDADESSRSIDVQSSFTLSNIARIYDPLLMSLRYLTVRDLLRVSMTSKFLNRIASDPYLWKTVRLRNSQVHDWNGFAKTLQKFGTKRLDMRKMLGSNVPEDLVKMWNNFLDVIPTITSLEHIDFSRAPTSVVDSVAASCPNLSVINALYLKNGSLQFENFANLKSLTKLRLKGVSGLQLERNEQRLQFINKDNLREISLTSVRNLDMDLLEMISEATNLVVLELGECAKLPADFAGETLSKLTKLEKLRLEKLQDFAPKYDFLNVIKDMNTLTYLELINIEVKEGFDDALASCKNLEHFLIIPTYVSQSATTNQVIINGIEKLSDTIKCFVWGLTTELLKITDLFMETWQGQKGNNSACVKKAVGDSVPIRKSVDKLSSDGDTVPTHVDILPVPKLEKMLNTLLPNTRVKVIKVPLSMTWRQSLSECLK